MTSNVDEGEKFIGVIQPFLNRHHSLLIVESALRVKSNDMVTAALS